MYGVFTSPQRLLLRSILAILLLAQFTPNTRAHSRKYSYTTEAIRSGRTVRAQYLIALVNRMRHAGEEFDPKLQSIARERHVTRSRGPHSQH